MLDLSDDTTPPSSRSARTVLGRLAVLAVIAVSAGVWIYVFSGQAARVAPDVLADPSYRALAEPTCAAAKAELDAVPDASAAADNLERAAQIVEANRILSAMVDDLTEHVDDPAVVLSDRDRTITLEWLADWRSYLESRQDLASRFVDDPNAALYVPAVGGERIDRRITRFANVNFMQSCVTPGDVR